MSRLIKGARLGGFRQGRGINIHLSDIELINLEERPLAVAARFCPTDGRLIVCVGADPHPLWLGFASLVDGTEVAADPLIEVPNLLSDAGEEQDPGPTPQPE